LNSQEERQIVVEEGQSGLLLYPKWDPIPENNCWDIQKCEPCCGEPCNFMDGLKCAVCWLCPCFSLCTLAKFFASSLDEPCAWINHCLPFVLIILFNIFCGWIPGVGFVPAMFMRTAIRHNSRVRNKTGNPIHYFGDCFMGNCPCTGCCGLCQELRSNTKDSWDWLAQMQKDGIPTKTGPIRFLRDDGAENQVKTKDEKPDKVDKPDKKEKKEKKVEKKAEKSKSEATSESPSSEESSEKAKPKSKSKSKSESESESKSKSKSESESEESVDSDESDDDD